MTSLAHVWNQKGRKQPPNGRDWATTKCETCLLLVNMCQEGLRALYHLEAENEAPMVSMRGLVNEVSVLAREHAQCNVKDQRANITSKVLLDLRNI